MGMKLQLRKMDKFLRFAAPVVNMVPLINNSVQ